MISFGEDRAAAERALARAKAAVSSHGALGVSASPMEMAEFLTLKERLRVAGASIAEAVEFFMRFGTLVKRPVDLSVNAVAWLRAAECRGQGAGRKPGDRVVPSNLKERWPAFWPKAGLLVWPNNGLRHTFASMHYAMWQDEAKLQAQMGHESANMLHQHYRALKTRREAERFWALTPKTVHGPTDPGCV